MSANLIKGMWKLGPRRDLNNFWPANVDVLLSVASLSTFASLSRQTVSLISQKCAYISRNIMATSRTVSSKITLKSNLFVCLYSIWTLHTHISLDILFSITLSCFHDTIFFCSGVHLVMSTPVRSMAVPNPKVYNIVLDSLYVCFFFPLLL